jgi:hypothetical protein
MMQREAVAARRTGLTPQTTSAYRSTRQGSAITTHPADPLRHEPFVALTPASAAIGARPDQA